MTTPPDSSSLHIGWDDLYTPETDGYVQQLQAAQAAPLVRAVGDATDAKPTWYRGQIVQMALAGLAGGIVAFGLQELIVRPDVLQATDDPTVSNVLFTVLIGFGIGLVIAAWEGIAARSLAKVGRMLAFAAPALLLTTLVGGFVANAIYSPWMESVYDRLLSQAIALDWTDAEFFQAAGNATHMPRGVAWAIVGLAAGVGIGLTSRQVQRVINGALGGLLGGFVGGVVFDFFTSGVSARITGIAITGLAIGLGIGLVEVARRQHWLEIMTGGMAGKQFILYSSRTTIGAGADNDVTLIKDPAIAAHHAVLTANERGISVGAVDPMAPLLINGAPVGSQGLTDGDVLQLGSTMLRYRDKAEQPVAPGAIVG
jgi:hypothetical protein